MIISLQVLSCNNGSLPTRPEFSGVRVFGTLQEAVKNEGYKVGNSNVGGFGKGSEKRD